MLNYRVKRWFNKSMTLGEVDLALCGFGYLPSCLKPLFMVIIVGGPKEGHDPSGEYLKSDFWYVLY